MALKFNPFTGKLDFSGSASGGGSGAFGAIYYFNRSNASSISGYYEMSKNLVIGAGTTLTATGAGTQLVGSFATVLNDPNVTTIPSGNWNFENYVSMSSNGGTPKIYGEIYSRNLAGTETLIATNVSNPHPINSGTLNELYLWSIAVPATSILATDRIVVKFYALNLGGRTMTMHFENSNVAQTTTSLPSVDLSAYVLKAGDTMTGKLNLPVSTTLSAPINIGTGSAPTSPINGDVWLTGSNLTWKGTSADIQEAAALKKANIFTRAQAVQLGVTDVGIGLKITNLGSGESLRIEDESPESTPFVVSASGRVGVGVAPDAAVALSLDTTGVKFGDGTIQTTAASGGTVTSVTGGTGLTGGTITTSGTIAVSYGTTAGTAAEGNDARLSNSRIPTAHASTHASAGSDPVTVTLTSQVTGTLPITNGGTGSTTAANALTALGAVAKAGDTMTGKLNLPASTTTEAGLNIGNGVNPTSPVTGDAWISGNTLRYFGTVARDVAVTNSSNVFAIGQAINGSSTVAALRITQTGTGEALRVEDETTPDATAFVISNTGRVGVGVTPDATVSLSVDTTGIKFSDNSIQTTAAVAGVTSVTATSPITSTGGTTPVISTSMATNRLLGRSTTGTGVAEEIAIGTGLSLTAGTLSNTGVLSDTTAAQGGTQLLNMVQITSAAYSAIVTPTANTLYIIVG